MKPNPKDPDWSFPYATRQTLERIRDYFNGFQTGGHPKGWHQLRHKAHVKKPTVPWESVPERFRAEVDRWFHMKLNQARAKGPVSPGKVRSLRMNAANYGRSVLTGKRLANRRLYERRKKIWIAYQDWERKQAAAATNQSRPKLQSRHLPI